MRKAERILSSSPKPTATKQQLLSPLAVERLKQALTLCAEIFHEEMTTSKAEYWSKRLSSYPPEGAIWAFQNWIDNGDFFPKPKDITHLVDLWRETMAQGIKTCGNCDNGWIIANPEAKRCDQKAKRCGCLVR